jgi:hypothetical protein
LWRDANANHTVAKRRDAHFRGTSRQLNAVLELFDALHISEMLPPCRRRATGSQRASQGDAGPTRKT